MALKAYTLGNDGFVDREVIAALGQPRHVSQATVILVAASKAAAVRMCESLDRWMQVPRLSDQEFRVSQSAAETFRDILVAGDPAVVVMPLIGHSGDLVVRIGADGPLRIGRVEWAPDGRYGAVFVPDQKSEE